LHGVVLGGYSESMRHIPVLACLLLSAACSIAVEDYLGHCGKQLLPKPINPRPGRKFARDRHVDLLHLKLDVTPDFKKRSVAGSAQMRFKPIARPVRKLELDAIQLSVTGITLEGANLKEWETTAEKLVIHFANPVSAGVEVTATITYSVQPEHGLYFRTPEMGFKPGDTQVFTQGEAELHRYWFPCYDFPNERFTSEVICHAPADMQVISNGKFIGAEKDAAGLMAHHWHQDQPHVNYLVALAAGYFHKMEDKVGDLPLAMFVPPSEKEQAANAFRDTKKIIDFYQREIGVPFPWAKYYQVYCLDFLAGGMENTSCTFEDAGSLFRNDEEELATLHRLDAHETAHQWFGDLVTCRDWSHLWLNEGFASYYTVLYEEQRSGRDAMLYSLWREAQRVLPNGNDVKPIVYRDYADPMEQFDYRNYPKACWMLHMIRSRLGPDLYRQSIQTYLKRHSNTVATTDDLQDVLEEQTGLSFDQFFDQWAHHGGNPELGITYAWDADTKLAKVSVKQTQKIGNEARLFAIDLPVRFTSKGSTKDQTLRVTQASEDFYVSLPAKPDLLRIDPDYTVLATIQFTPTREMLKLQLKSDMVGRMLAAQELAKHRDAEAIALLKDTLNNDAFHGPRSEAARALKAIGSKEAVEALAASVQQKDARVRNEVVEALAASTEATAQTALWTLAQSEKNPRILGSILKSWGMRPGQKEVSDALRRHLSAPSYHEMVAAAAIAGLKAQDDASSVPAILEKLKAAESNFEDWGLADALNAIGFLARKDKDRSTTRNALASYLTHARLNVRTAAAEALGLLADPSAIALLEPLTQVAKPWQDSLRTAAEASLQKLHAEEERPTELKKVWEKMQALEKELQQLKAAEATKNAKAKK
jgi:aminopeptidase N